MRKRKTTGVPVQVYNLGSPAGAQMDFERDELWSRMDAEMGKKAVSLPVFLVNPNQMDMLYPREYRRALDPEQIRKLLQEEALREAQKREREQETGEWRERREEEPNFFDRLQRSEEDQIGWSKYSEVILVGLYLHLERCDQNFRSGVLRQGDSNAQTAEAENAFLNHQAPAIFLCCERIVDWASRVGVSHHLVMDKVYYHELGHGVMDTLPDGAPNPYFETWGRIVEESLANAIAYRCFSGTEARWVQRLIQDQPAEYLGYAAASKLWVGPVFLMRRGIFLDWYYRSLRRLVWYWRRETEDVLEALERGEWHPRVARTLEVLRLLPTPLTHPKWHESIDFLNITEWKNFKQSMALPRPWERKIWKDFAKHLLIEGVS